MNGIKIKRINYCHLRVEAVGSCLLEDFEILTWAPSGEEEGKYGDDETRGGY